MSLIKIHDELYVPDNFAEDHSYYADAEGKRAYTGITTILGVIAKPALVPWAAKIATEYIREHVEYAIPGEDGGYWAIKPSTVEEAKNAHRKKKEAAGEAGTDLHALAEGWIKMCIQEFDGRALSVCPAGLEQFRDWADSENIRFVASEKKLYSKTWWIAGTCDMVFEKDGKMFLGDIKTFKKIFDRVPFFQMAGYANMNEEMGEGEIAGYCIIRLSKDGSFEAKWSFDTIGDTKAFFAAVELYRQLKNF